MIGSAACKFHDLWSWPLMLSIGMDMALYIVTKVIDKED